MENRKTILTRWAQRQIAQLHGTSEIALSLQDLSGDASFRRYYRVELPATYTVTSYLVVDSPPETEKNETFVRVANAFRQANVSTPQVLRVDYQSGFMLQEDFGDDLFLKALQTGFDKPENIDRLYKLAIDALVRIQKGVSPQGFAPYDRDLLVKEMQLFQDWFCELYLALVLSDSEHRLIGDTLQFLAQQALSQPQVVVHRDYHSRNLMIPDPARYGTEKIPGVIDFQDAVVGAYTYDLVSLLRDYYISWPLPYVQNLALYYLDKATQSGVIPRPVQEGVERGVNEGIDSHHFFRDLDLMGLQRNLKVIGIFARLSIRDNKSQYLADIPQAIHYFLTVAQHYPELEEFLTWFKQRVLPLALSKLPSGELCEQ